MNWLDIVILIAIVLFTFVGLKNGLIKTAISLAGLLVGIILAGRFSSLLASYLTFIQSKQIANIAAFIIIFVAILVMATVLSFILTKVASAILLGWLDHLAGGAVGLVTGAIICAALLAIWVKWLGPNASILQSQIAAVLLDKFPFILSLLPSEFNSIGQFFH
jgi:membrane protein required for colicin V production